MPVAVHATIKSFSEGSPLKADVEIQPIGKCRHLEKSDLITYPITESGSKIGECLVLKVFAILIAHNCTGYHLRRATFSAISALLKSFDFLKKRLRFDYQTNVINSNA